MRGVALFQGFSATARGGAPRLALWLTGAGLAAGALSGCGSSRTTSSVAAPSPQAIEREERSEESLGLKGEESAEAQKQRELLSVIEAKKTEEEAAAKARRTLAAANAKAKRREKAAELAAKKKEKEAAEKAKKQAAEKNKTKPTTKKPATGKTPSTGESTAAPPTVTVPSGGN